MDGRQDSAETRPVLACEEVTFRHRGAGASALAGVDLSVAPGETVVLLGASGAGKSTLCLAANGLAPHFVRGTLGGRVLTAGRDTREHPPRSFAADVGVVFQDFESQIFASTVELEAAFCPENLALPPREIRAHVDEALARVGLTGLERRSPAALSGGQKQRLVLAAALAGGPSLLVLDEPASDLDPAGRAEVHAVARSLRSRRRTALLIAEPEAEEAGGADRVAVLSRGRIVLDGPPQEVLARADVLRAAGVPLPAAAAVTERLGLPVTPDPVRAAAIIRAAGWRPRPGARAPQAPAAGPPRLAARGLTYSYPGGPPVLQGLDLQIGAGEIVAILGSNGSGKSTLARLLAGLLPAPRGSIQLAGRDPADLPRGEAGRLAGFVFQNPDHQIFAETVEAEVGFGPHLQGLGPRETRARVEESLAAVGLLERRDADPFLLSKGERQRVAVASVLATRPEVLILDEPTTGLDHREVDEMMALVRRLNGAGHTVVMITHAMRVAAEHARRVVAMAGGKIVADGPPEEVFHRPELLARAALRPPGAAVLAGLLGCAAVSVDGLVAALERG
ncbi:MAG TPA: energy-coupling factor transporter ATPase [Candidatus Methanoperedens sp.]|nr:energy-coupling factor transporter ATPase [Candidatus Methanoperedens sp.]